MSNTIYWYDYETFGKDPMRDRPAQFAGVRTDEDLNPVSGPQVFFCRPAPDYLPDPEACLLTGITPQQAMVQGVSEVEFIGRINREFSVPDTCVAGYNSIRFDDEVTRHTLYRNLMDPYAREWRNNNSRWDLIDSLRLAYALRPDGINWPVREGQVSFRLGDLTEANGLAHENAHDAMSDVWATISVARLLRDRQRRLFDFLFRNRGKQAAMKLLATGEMQPLIHASSRYPASRHCVAVVVALARHPVNPNGVLVYDLSVDPARFEGLSPEELRQRVFTPVGELPPDAVRLPVKTVHINKCPVLAPRATLRDQDAERLGIDLVACDRHLEYIRQHPGFLQVVRASQLPVAGFVREENPDYQLYEGFFSDADRRTMEQILNLSPESLVDLRPEFEDERLPELFFRFRARNYPHTLSQDEVERWRVHCRECVGDGAANYPSRLSELDATVEPGSRPAEVLAELRRYAAALTQ